MTRILIEVAIFGILVLGGLALWQVHDHNEIEKGIARQVAAEKAAAAKQSQIDDRKLKAAGDAHAAEIAAIHAAAKPAPSVRCYASASRMPQTAVPGGVSPSAAVVQGNADVPVDRSRSLYLLIDVADRLSADARELNAAVR